MMQWHIVCDFDGTITGTDVIDNILQRFADASWEAIEDQWMKGEIGSRECLRRQLSLVQASPAQLLAYFDSVDIDPDFPDFVDHVISLGASNKPSRGSWRVTTSPCCQYSPIACAKWTKTAGVSTSLTPAMLAVPPRATASASPHPAANACW